ncbi:MAG: transcriptional regulator [Anaerolineales bacterium]|jgi:DNA-binding MarR family transcriptional regulator
MENKSLDIAHNLQDINRLVHEPSRLLILAILNAVESADFLYLLRETQLTKGNLSSHLAKLEGGGLVEIEKTFQGKIPLTICRLTDEGRMAFETYRKQMQNFFNQTSG